MLGTLRADAGQPGWSPVEKRVGQLTDPLPRRRIGQMWLGPGLELPVRSVKRLLAVAVAVAAARFVHVLAGRPWPAAAAAVAAAVVAVVVAAVVVVVVVVVVAAVVGATAAGPCWSG